GAPGLLDTLGEIADALADNDDAMAALTTAINARALQTALHAQATPRAGADDALDDAIAAEATARNAADLLYAQQAENTAEVVAQGLYEISENHLASEVTTRTTAHATNAAAIA